MRKFLALALLAAVVPLPAAGVTAVETGYETGRQLPRIDVVDDTGRIRSTDEWKGVPTLLVPMYTRCPLACPAITAGIKRGTGEASARPDTYRVVLFSFDPRDTPGNLRAFREAHALPLAWSVVTARPADVRRALDAIGYRTAAAGEGFSHPNLVVALTPRLRTARYLPGTSFSGREIDDALTIARGGRDWIGDYGRWMLAVLLLVCTLSAVYLVVLLGQSRGKAEVPIS